MKVILNFTIDVEGHHRDEHSRVFEDSSSELFLSYLESFLNELRSAYLPLDYRIPKNTLSHLERKEML